MHQHATLSGGIGRLCDLSVGTRESLESSRQIASQLRKLGRESQSLLGKVACVREVLPLEVSGGEVVQEEDRERGHVDRALVVGDVLVDRDVLVAESNAPQRPEEGKAQPV